MAIDLNFDEQIKASLAKHMRAQPYDCFCARCNESLRFRAEVDDDLDMALAIEPCDCQAKNPKESQ